MTPSQQAKGVSMSTKPHGLTGKPSNNKGKGSNASVHIRANPAHKAAWEQVSKKGFKGLTDFITQQANSHPEVKKILDK
jgi:hypothetical protein